MISLNGPAPHTIPGSRVKVIFAADALAGIGPIARDEGATRVLLVSDQGIRAAGHVERAVLSLYRAGLPVRVFDDVGQNPTTIHVGKGVIAANPFKPDLIIGLGGGSAMDCAKGINFILSGGGRMQDYWGTGKAKGNLLPMIAVPTTAGTGSDAQSFALITDPETHQKMACGDPRALPRLAVLDPALTATQPPHVAAATGIDAIAHAVETAGTTRRNDVSRHLSKEAWSLLESAYERVMGDPKDAPARANMLLGAHLAGAAIENSMLGAAHALANPLTGLCGIVHGVAVGLMLPHVVRFNSQDDARPYADLIDDPEQLACRIESLLDAGNLPRALSQCDVPESRLPKLAALAATQWTAQYNPRPVNESALLDIYRMAL